MPISAQFSAPSKAALAVFCRAPRLGEVKTRLAASRGADFALGLYRAMLADTFALGRALAPEVETFACFTPADAFDDDSISELWNGPKLAQCEGDLGARMLDCFVQLRSRSYEKVAIIGSDSPDLPFKRLKRAFEKLENLPLILAPSPDGGFYLLGTSADVPQQLFKNVRWSSTNTRRDLIANLTEYDHRARMVWRFPLPAWRDVDDEADLLELRRRIFELGTHAPQTRQFLEENLAQNRGGAET
jgi:hypothetical protein